MKKTAAYSAAFAAAPLPVAPAAPATADALAHAARIILPHLERGQRVDAPALRASMESAYRGSDADGAWDWKTVYDACEAATVLFLRKFGPAMRARAASPAASLPMLAVRRSMRGLQNDARKIISFFHKRGDYRLITKAKLASFGDPA